MKFLSFIASFVLVAVAIAGVPSNGSGYGLTQEFAENVVEQFITILSHSDIAAANTTAQALLCDEGFKETSDSILSLEGKDV